MVFDEAEKAHPEVFDLLLQMLDEGRLTDSVGRTVSFRNTIVVMTSNLGSEAILDEDADDATIEAAIEEALGNFFRPEMLNRIDERVVFRRLTHEAIEKIVVLELESLSERLMDRGLDLSLDEASLALLAREGFEPAFGARPVKRAIRRWVEDPLALALLEGRFDDADGIMVTVRDDGAALSFTPRNQDIET